MSSTLSESIEQATGWRWYWIVYAIVLAVVVLVGVEVHNEMISALEQCAPNCNLRG